MPVNYSTLVLGVLYLYAVGHLSTRAKSRPLSQHFIEVLLCAAQTFFAMGICNLTGVENSNHAIQLGIYLFVGFRVLDIYCHWMSQYRMPDSLPLTLFRGLLSTVGFTWLIYMIGMPIYFPS